MVENYFALWGFLCVISILLYIVNMITTVQSDIRSIKSIIGEMFYFVPKRHHAVENAAKEIDLCDSKVTSTSIMIEGYVFSLTTPHVRCTPESVERLSLVACPGVDAAFGTECPSTDSVLEISFEDVATAAQGEKVVATGYSFVTRETVYEGIVGGMDLCGQSFDENPWEGGTYGDCNSYFFIHGDQAGGMSGSLVLGHQGVVGVVSSTLPAEIPSSNDHHGKAPRSRRAIVGKFSHIFHNCLIPNLSKMKRARDCSNIKRAFAVPKINVEREHIVHSRKIHD